MWLSCIEVSKRNGSPVDCLIILQQFIAVAAALLCPKFRMRMIYPVERGFGDRISQSGSTLDLEDFAQYIYNQKFSRLNIAISFLINFSTSCKDFGHQLNSKEKMDIYAGKYTKFRDFLDVMKLDMV